MVGNCPTVDPCTSACVCKAVRQKQVKSPVHTTSAHLRSCYPCTAVRYPLTHGLRLRSLLEFVGVLRQQLCSPREAIVARQVTEMFEEIYENEAYCVDIIFFTFCFLAV